MLSKNGLPSRQEPHLESPFLEDELFAREVDHGWEPGQLTLAAHSPFQRAFEEGRATPIAAGEPGVDFAQQAAVDEFAAEEAEPYGEVEPEDGLTEADYEDEAVEVEGETDEVAAQTRMKFEFQTFNRIWRNNGKSASPLLRKYGPKDFLVDKKGVRLESETNAVLEFETDWFRSWPKLEQALDEAVKMTDAMNSADSSRLEKSRKAFPFDVAHLRTGSATERERGYWNPDSSRYENWPWNKDKKREIERILAAGEELEIELVDSTWKASIQSSESFLLEYYESFLRQHEWPRYRDGAIKQATAMLAAVNADRIPVGQLEKLRGLLQIITNYVMRGQATDVRGKPSKFAFPLMSRTNFASMYKVLLTERERRLFQRIVRDDVALKVAGMDRNSPLFVNGYGQRPEPGPTVYKWLSGIPAGVDLLSERSGKGVSDAMGRYDVESRRGKKDRWLVKFETRNTTLGATGIEAKDWVKYASMLFDTASNRERDALELLRQRGLADEDQLTNFVFHARNPDLGGHRIRKGEQTLAQQWLRLRSEVVRAALPAPQRELRDALRDIPGEDRTGSFENGETEQDVLFREEATPAQKTSGDFARSLRARFPNGVNVAVYSTDDKEFGRRADEWAKREDAIGLASVRGAPTLGFGVATADSTGLVRAVTNLRIALKAATSDDGADGGQSPALIRTLALFSHGWDSTLAIGNGLHASNAGDVIGRIASALSADCTVVLYGCSVCAEAGESGWVATTMEPGGSRSLCAVLRDALVDAGKTHASVWGHTQVGHTTRNWSLRAFYADASRANGGKGAAGEAYAGQFVFGAQKAGALQQLEQAIRQLGYSVDDAKRTEFIRFVRGRISRHMYTAYGQANKHRKHRDANLSEVAPLNPNEVAQIVRTYWSSDYWTPARVKEVAKEAVRRLRGLGVIRRAAARELLANEEQTAPMAFEDEAWPEEPDDLTMELEDRVALDDNL